MCNSAEYNPSVIIMPFNVYITNPGDLELFEISNLFTILSSFIARTQKYISSTAVTYVVLFWSVARFEISFI